MKKSLLFVSGFHGTAGRCGQRRHSDAEDCLPRFRCPEWDGLSWLKRRRRASPASRYPPKSGTPFGELKEAALNKEFDVLLVFMFDRLGRIENETPFVLEWFADHGIEVWSVNEGQQKFDQHVDKLMNYIRLRQASGESKRPPSVSRPVCTGWWRKGSIQAAVCHTDICLWIRAEKNKKGQVMRDLAVCPEEAEIVREIFRMIAEEGYGSHRMASYLNKKGNQNAQ